LHSGLNTTISVAPFRSKPNVIHLQSASKASSTLSVGQEQLAEFRQASSRYGDAAWRENACSGIALVHDL
jgi:hypothetical protein